MAETNDISPKAKTEEREPFQPVCDRAQWRPATAVRPAAEFGAAANMAAPKSINYKKIQDFNKKKSFVLVAANAQTCCQAEWQVWRCTSAMERETKLPAKQAGWQRP